MYCCSCTAASGGPGSAPSWSKYTTVLPSRTLRNLPWQQRKGRWVRGWGMRVGVGYDGMRFRVGLIYVWGDRSHCKPSTPVMIPPHLR